MPYKDYELGKQKKKEYYQRNKERLNAQNSELVRQKYWATKREIFDLLGNKCSVCGWEDWRALEIDHVLDNGYSERKLHGRGVRALQYILSEIKKGSKDYQLLCCNHNRIKRFLKCANPT